MSAVAGLLGRLWWAPTVASESQTAEGTGPTEDPPPSVEHEPIQGCPLYTAETLLEAQLVLDLLEEAGLEATLFNEHLIGAMGELPVSQCWPKIWLVDRTQLAEARGVVETYEARKRQTGMGERLCGACGEESPGNFEVCWSCRAPFE